MPCPGSNSGVGYATAEAIASASTDYHVILAARTSEKAANAESELKATGTIKGSLSTVQIDVTDSDSIERAVTEVEKEFGHLDVLINNAGVGSCDDDIKTRMQLCMDTNVIGPAVMEASFRPLLFKSSNPRTVYVTSGVGSLGIAADPSWKVYTKFTKAEAYRASKAALNMLALQEHREHGDKIKVFAVCPGFVRSNLRGTSEEERSGWGKAGDTKESGQGILDIVEGKRDEGRAKFLYKDGEYPW